MKRFLFLLNLMLLLTSCGASKSLSYNYKPLFPEGCNVSFSAVRLEDAANIVVTVTSDRLVFASDPVMMLRNFDDEVLALNGIPISAQSMSHPVSAGNGIIVSSDELKAMAQFKVSQEQIPFFKCGIKKIRLTTVPIIHEREFNQDRIGKWLYRELNKVSKEDTF